MRFFRVLFLLLVGAGLTVQAAAYATAPVVPQGDAEVHCADMVMPGSGQMQDESDHATPCKHMGFACLVSMNCLPPLLGLPTPADLAALPATSDSFIPMHADLLSDPAIGPVPPPPRPIS